MSPAKAVLILDEQSVASSRGVTFHLNPATKHPENPVMLPGEPHEWDSLQVSWPGAVIYSPAERKFRCWYAGFDAIQSPGRVWRTGYAESDDGVNWRKPKLGQVEFLGMPTNQLKPETNPAFMSAAFENPIPGAPPSQRFGSYWIETRVITDDAGTQKNLWAKTLYWSPDGVTWSRGDIAYGEKLRAPFLDISQLLYDPGDPDPSMRWKAYGQSLLPDPGSTGPFGVRKIGLACGADVTKVQDAEDLIVLAPEPGIDEEIHFAAVQKFGGTYMMLFESDRFSRNPIHGDLRIAVSSDGRNFRRVHTRSPLVATGPKGTWDENLLVTHSAGMQVVGDEVYIHYFGCPNIYNSWPAQYAKTAERRGSMFAPVYLGLATLPLDRFGYAAGEGSVATHPIEVGANGLWVNADGDGVTVSAMRGDGSRVARGTLGRERARRVYRPVVWSDGSLPGGLYALELRLTASDRLYSVAC